MHAPPYMKPLYALSGLVALLLTTAACASAPQPAPVRMAVSTTRVTSAVAEDSDPLCDLVFDRPQVVDVDIRAREEANAEAVLRSMEKDLLGCYTRRVAAAPDAHAYMTLDVVIAPDGHVQRVETTGGALLGDAALACMTKTLEKATFEPPAGGGTMRISVPMALRRVVPGEAP